jgi:SAM-dependent methyltransferase
MRLNKRQGLRPKQVPGIAVSVKQCQDCGLIFADPQPHPERLTDHYDSPEEYWGTESFVENKQYFSNEIRAVKPLINFEIGMRALDVGAGTGQGMKALANAGFDVWGIEPISGFRDVALRRGVEEERLALAAIEDAQFERTSFDFITFGAVLEHLYSPSAAVEKALGWLKPGGIVHIEVPSSRYFVSKLLNAVLRLRGTNYVTHISPMHPPFHLYEFALQSFLKHGARSGYSVARCDYFVGEIVHLPHWVAAMLGWHMRRTNSGMLLVLYLRKRAQ